jgi:hypothetical protein
MTRCLSVHSQVGLDAAGKTTILYKLKLGEIVTTIPTIGTKRAGSARLHHGAVVTVWHVTCVCPSRKYNLFREVTKASSVLG